MSESIEEELRSLYAKIHQTEKPRQEDLKRIYELIGILFRSRYGAESLENPCSVPPISAVVLKMAEKIPKGSLLNVGMGAFPFVDIELSRRGFKVFGVEYSHSLLTLSLEVLQKNNDAKLSALNADGTHLPFRDRVFDVCLCSETVEHIPDDRSVVREIARVLKPGGYMIFTVPCILDLMDLGKRLGAMLKGKSAVLMPEHLREYTYFSAKQLIRRDFEILAWESVPFTLEPFSKMPLEAFCSRLVGLPLLKHFSLSIAFLLRKKTAL